MTKNKWVPIVAAIVLVFAIGASVYTFIQQSDAGNVEINGTTYGSKELMEMGSERAVEDYSGVALDELVISAGIAAPEAKEYTLIGADGYQKTVTWENMQNGILTPELMSVFSDLAKAFQVKDIIEIKAE
jgi:hypothetical protein